MGRLVIDAAATIAGELLVAGAGSYVPPVGTNFALVTYASESGTFSSVNININGHGGTTHYNPTNVTITTT